MDKTHLTQVGRALKQLGIEHIAAWLRPPRFTLPEARGRSERAFRTHQGRLPQELAKAGVTDMASANRYLEQIYMARHNAEFGVKPAAEGTAFIPYIGGR